MKRGAPKADPERDRMIDRLLSGRDAPSVQEQEILFERVVARVSPRRRAGAWITGALLAAASVLAMFSLRTSPDVLTPRGGASVPP